MSIYKDRFDASPNDVDSAAAQPEIPLRDIAAHFSELAREEATMSTPTDERPAFRIVIPAAKVDDALIADLAGPRWKLALTQLYLRAGMYIPHRAKVAGARFGFCDSNGEQQPRAQATHFGWTTGR